MREVLYSVRDLSVEYLTRAGPIKAVSDVSFDIYRGEVLGLVGESGCGKSTLGKALMAMIRPPGRITGGTLEFDGVDLLTLSERRLRSLRGARIGMVFQDPMTSLDPLQKVADHITETIRTHEPGFSEYAARMQAEELVERLGIRADRIDDHPHQFSGGMRQRIMIALALALRADLVIADEPTTSLDVIVEAKFLDLLRELRQEFNLTIVLITHNIGVVAEVADRVAVMYAGRMAELGSVYEVFAEPKHPYTQGLLRSVPSIDVADEQLYRMRGQPPHLAHLPQGCPFHPRCPSVMDVCRRVMPPFEPARRDQKVACWLYHPHPEARPSADLPS